MNRVEQYVYNRAYTGVIPSMSQHAPPTVAEVIHYSGEPLQRARVILKELISSGVLAVTDAGRVVFTEKK